MLVSCSANDFRQFKTIISWYDRQWGRHGGLLLRKKNTESFVTWKTPYNLHCMSSEMGVYLTNDIFTV